MIIHTMQNMQLKRVCKMALEAMKPQLIHIARVSFWEGGHLLRPPWLLLASLGYVENSILHVDISIIKALTTQ